MARVVPRCGSPVCRRLTQEEANRVAGDARVQTGTNTPRLSDARASSSLNAWRRQVPLAEIRSPSQELGRATLGRKGDTRRDEQRGVAVVLSPGVAEDRLSSLSRCDAHRVDGGVAIRVGQRDAGAHALDQRHDGWRPQSWLVLLRPVTAKDSSGSRPVASSSVTSAPPIVPFDNSIASNGNRVCPGWSGLDQPRPGRPRQYPRRLR